MRTQIFIFFLGLLVCSNSYAQNKINLAPSYHGPIKQELKPFYSISEGQLEDLMKGEVISSGKVESPGKSLQSMMMFVSGIHPRNCTRAMRKLSLYENYSQYMDFVKESKYDDKKEKIALTIDHALLPFPMVVAFKIPRITKEGKYPFTFENGFLKDLKGTIALKEMGDYCLMTLKSDWVGPETKIPNIVFQAFVQTVGKLGLEHLIRVSRF